MTAIFCHLDPCALISTLQCFSETEREALLATGDD